MKNNKLTGWIRTIVIFCGIALFAIFFFPMWRIELSAPQYPEGLVLLIFPNKLGGDVDIINGLNHYIGMKTLHAENFIEFTVLPYIIGALATFTLMTGLINRKKIFIGLTILFIATSILTMADFWKWEYNYGHELNPDAAIKVPGMAYQPPLIGYKQLLNFGAYSIPDVGGWIFAGAGILLAGSCFFEIYKSRKSKKIIHITNKKGATITTFSAMMMFFFISCDDGPVKLQLEKDNCDFCKMTISDPRFGAEIITDKGKAYKFDDMYCIVSYIKSGMLAEKEIKQIYLTDFIGTHDLKKVNEMNLLKSGDLRSPMGGNVAAFTNKDSLSKVMEIYKGQVVNWDDLRK